MSVVTRLGWLVGVRVAVTIVAALLLPAVVARAEGYRGDMNGWSSTWMAQDASFGGTWKTTLTSTTSRASSAFKFDRSGDWAEQWGTGPGHVAAAANASLGQARKNVEGNSPGDLVFTNETSGRRYTFSLAGDATWWDRPYAIQETDADPVAIARVFDDHVKDPSTSAVSVTVQLVTNKSPQESVWVRYATDVAFTSNALVPANGSGTNFTASIPAPAEGARIYYYALTTAMPSNALAANADLCTLRGFKNGISNFLFRAGAANSWHWPGNAEPAGAFMRNPPTNGVPANAAVYIYNGTYAGGYNQTGGALHYREAGGGAWSTSALGFDSNAGNNQYWKTAITGNTFSAGAEVEYYLTVTYSDAETVYLGSTNGTDCVKYLVEANAQANPYRFTYGAPAVSLGNAWHNPYAYEPPGAYMRNPRNPYADAAVYVYNGNQFQGTGNAADQSGGTLYHRLAPTGTWQTAALAFDIETGNNKYWKAVIPANAYGITNTIQYYLRIAYNDRDTTWLGTADNINSIPLASEAAAQAQPFSVTYGGEAGTEAAYLWHANNRVSVGGGAVQFWTKIGYAEGTGSNRWVDAGAIYYTTNGTVPQVAGKGVAGNADTRVQPLTFSHMEEDAYAGGDAMWWVATATNLPAYDGSVVTYKIGAWNGAGVERFAEYGTDQPADTTFSFSLFVAGAAGLTANGVNADYTATKLFIDELADETQTVSVVYTPPVAGASNVQVYCNVDRRDLCDVDYNHDGIPDGVRPPDGNTISASDTGAYFTAFAMAGGPTTYYWTGTVSRCGAYRLTARYQKDATSAQDWRWYSSEGRRDHAVVVSPRKVHAMTMYELNPLTVKAASDTQSGRSTFADLLAGDSSGYTNFNLGYLDNLSVNCLWFQPIHPNAQERKDGYEPGSPYASRNYFAVSRWFGRDGTEAGAMTEFTNFIQSCDAWTGGVGTINVMLDGVFNHSSWDAVLGAGGVDLGITANPDTRIGTARPGWYSLWTDYGLPATFYTSATENDIATAPDRGDFGKWFDVAEFFFGRYSCLVRHNPENNSDYLNEGDVYDFAGMDAATRDLWRYFAYYPEYWLRKTGHRGANSTAADGSYAQRLALDDRGIDGLRCDFGQGLPPQVWEYIINRTRHRKWNFVFMAETLDGGVPGYRSNRHFDILNESLVFKFTQEHVGASWQVRQALEDRRTAYRGGTVLLNLTSHDEVMPEADPWMTASRYGTLSMVDGVPMIFYGQEWGIAPSSGEAGTANSGFAHFEQNFGKWVPHFKSWNKLTVWENPPAFSGGLPEWYSRVNRARHRSPALRSVNRFFLPRMSDGGDNPLILAAAKYDQPGVGPAAGDVVLAFALMLNTAHDEAQDVYNLQPCWSQLGLDTNKLYNVRNLAATDPSAYLWPSNVPGSRLWSEGVWVHLQADHGGPITADGALVQYLKLEEFTPASTVSLTVQTPYGIADPPVGVHVYAAGTTLTNRVTPSVDAGSTQYVATGWILSGNEPASGSGAQFEATLTNSAVLTWAWATNYWLETAAGAHGSVLPAAGWQHAETSVLAQATADTYYHFTNWTGDVAAPDANANPLSVPMPGPRWITAWFAENLTSNTQTPEWWLAQHGLTNGFEAEAAGDADGDGLLTWQEYIAGTLPTSRVSVLRATAIGSAPAPAQSQRVLLWRSETQRVYAVEAAPALLTNLWTRVASNLPATPPENVWTDTVDRGSLQFYRIDVTAP